MPLSQEKIYGANQAIQMLRRSGYEAGMRDKFVDEVTVYAWGSRDCSRNTGTQLRGCHWCG